MKTHLSHIYAKLNVSNRTELAALATEHQHEVTCVPPNGLPAARAD